MIYFKKFESIFDEVEEYEHYSMFKKILLNRLYNISNLNITYKDHTIIAEIKDSHEYYDSYLDFLFKYSQKTNKVSWSWTIKQDYTNKEVSNTNESKAYNINDAVSIFMEEFEKSQAYNNFETIDVEYKFLHWLSYKMNFKINNDTYISYPPVIHGDTYDIGNNKVLLLTYPNVSDYQQLLNKNIDGVAKHYSTGIIKVPHKFRKYDEDSYVGIELLNPDHKVHRDDDEIGYVIFEKLKFDKELTDNLKFINSSIWFNYKSHEYAERHVLKDDREKAWGSKIMHDWHKDIHKDVSVIGKSGNINKIIQTAEKGYGQFMIASIFKNPTNVEFKISLTMFIKTQFYDYSKSKLYVAIVDRLFKIANNLHKEKLEWDFPHAESFGYNTKNLITAISIDDNWKNEKEAKFLTPKNIVRESI